MICNGWGCRLHLCFNISQGKEMPKIRSVLTELAVVGKIIPNTLRLHLPQCDPCKACIWHNCHVGVPV